MADTFNGDFARLIPRNQIAQRLFSATCVYVEENKTFHLRFLQWNNAGSELSSAPHEPVESSTDYESQAEGETERLQMQDSGYFVLSFDQEREPEFPHLGWRVGRGAGKSPLNRGVDLLLSRPGDCLSRSLAGVHMIFQFHTSSGLLMLKGGSHKAPVELRLGNDWVKLEYDEKQLIYERSVRIRAGMCEYELEHTVEEKYRALYFDERDKFLQAQVPRNLELKTEPLRRIPGDSCILRGQYLELETRGSGAFGWITRGLDTKTGDIVAIKELRIGAKTKSEVMAEVNMGKRFNNMPGLLPTIDAICEHGRPEICCDLERLFLFMPSAISDFSGGFWGKTGISRLAKLYLLREPLIGLMTLHSMGIMHRDIRLKNTLIISTEPPRASLCDYGKAIEANTSKVTTIGPIHTLAPEVWTVSKNGPYTAKIDTWAYGYAIAEVLGYKPLNNSKVTRERLSSIFSFLRASHIPGTDDESLIDLVSKLLVWRPQNRWTAEQALEHECWLPITQNLDSIHNDPAEDVKGNTAKRKRVIQRDPSSDPRKAATAGIDLQATQEFSQATNAMIERRLARGKKSGTAG